MSVEFSPDGSKMIARRFLIGLLIALFLPAPRGNDVSFLLNLPAVVLNFFEMRQVDHAVVDSPEDRTSEETRYNTAFQTDCPVDLFEGLLEKETEKELEEDEGKDNKNSKYDFLSIQTQFHFDHEMIFGCNPGQLNQVYQHYDSGRIILRC